jgi:hypothetical protein
MEVQLHQTREAWLHYVAQRMAPIFDQLRAPLPQQLRIAMGFTSSGRRSKYIGECWDNQCSADGHFEIFIRPDLSESQELLPMQVAAITAGPEFEQALRPILAAAGPLPHGRLRLAPAATAEAKGHTLVRSNVPVAIAATRFISGANGSIWLGHRYVPSTVKCTSRRHKLIDEW